MVGLEINPPPSGLETPKWKRKKLSEEHRIKISEGIQKTWARKHYEKAMGWIDGVPNRAHPEPFAEECGRFGERSVGKMPSDETCRGGHVFFREAARERKAGRHEGRELITGLSRLAAAARSGAG